MYFVREDYSYDYLLVQTIIVQKAHNFENRGGDGDGFWVHFFVKLTKFTNRISIHLKK